ncbi:MAG: MerR family transcriptional regulator [Gemmatimonadota bacterium]
MRDYTVRTLARMAGITVRTLHHYDRIGLLVPSRRTAAGYRKYGEEDLLRLQQILFFRELDFTLAQIGEVLDDPTFDRVEALRNHGRLIEQRIERLRHLRTTVDRTIQRLEEDGMTSEDRSLVADEELYAGFASKEEGRALEREAAEKYGEELVAESNRKVRKMTKGEWTLVQAEGDRIYADFSALAGRDATDPEVQGVVARHWRHIEHFFPVTGEVYRGLAALYLEDARFRAFFERNRPGLAEFVSAAMKFYAGEE